MSEPEQLHTSPKVWSTGSVHCPGTAQNFARLLSCGPNFLVLKNRNVRKAQKWWEVLGVSACMSVCLSGVWCVCVCV